MTLQLFMQQAVLFLVCGGVARCRTTTVLFFSLLKSSYLGGSPQTFCWEVPYKKESDS